MINDQSSLSPADQDDLEFVEEDIPFVDDFESRQEKNEPPAELQFFPLLVISLNLFRTTKAFPVQIFTSWENIMNEIRNLIKSPSTAVMLTGIRVSESEWDPETWERIKEESIRTSEPVVFQVKLKIRLQRL